MKRALVLGANGQDGSLLCEELIVAGRQVLGLGRQPVFLYGLVSTQFDYTALDITQTEALEQCLREWCPDEIYHVAAIHGSSGFEYERLWGQALNVNVRSLHALLEYVRLHSPRSSVFYASSAKVFSGTLRDRVNLETPRDGKCLYAITKQAAGALAEHYRRNHGVTATVGILFNHESDRRPPGFFIPRLCRIVRTALEQSSYKESVQTLSFYCDWSSARDFMRMAVSAVETHFSGELIFASGNVWHGQAFARELFSRYGLDVARHVDPAEEHSCEPFEVDISETRRQLPCVPKEDIFDVCKALIGRRPGTDLAPLPTV